MAKLRAPTATGAVLLEPAAGQVALARANELALSAATLWGRSLSEQRNVARAEVLALATRYTSSLLPSVAQPSTLNSPPPAPQPLWFVGGHQPELYHPGVWAKSAAIDELAEQSGGVGLNLTVDNDLCSGATVSVPRGPDQIGLTTLEWDQPRPQSPWEERPGPDPSRFSSFGSRCQEHLRPWGIEPLAAAQDWGGATELKLVDRLVRLRARFERGAGLSNLELRVSQLSETECFRQFVADLVQHAQPFASVYNIAVTQYRQLHHVRSESHPVPTLAVDSRGSELPLWVWRAGETRRRPLFVRAGVLHDGEREIGALSTAPRNGWKIRPRALSLTLFCRLLLGSAFIHGIGGALYDQVTNTIIQNLMGIDPPGLIVATATLKLFEPFAGADPYAGIARRERDRRALRWSPELLFERLAATDPFDERLVLDLIAHKQLLVDEINASKRSPATHPNRHELAASRHTRIQDLNERLRMHLPAELDATIAAELVALHQQSPHWDHLRSREYSSNLFPASQIQELFRNVRRQISQGPTGRETNL